MSEVWTSYRDLTRFLESTRLAIGRERALWAGAEFRHADAIVLRSEGIGGPPSVYEIGIDEHLSSLADDEVLAGLVLLKTVSLGEELVRLAMGVDRLDGGVEAWGDACLAHAGRTWNDVHQGKPGLVEVYVHRNAIAHGNRTWTLDMSDRLALAGATSPAVGAPVVVATRLEELRARVRSLMRATGLTIS